MPSYYPPSPINLIVAPPQEQYNPELIPFPIPTPPVQDYSANPLQTGPITKGDTLESNDHRPVATEGLVVRLYQSPSPPPLVLDEYPPLIVLKTGAMYTATKFWVKAGTFYFVTTQNDTLQIPLGLVEHVYPKVKQSRTAEK